MNYIEQILTKVLQERLGLTLSEYEKMVTPDEVEYDKALIEATILEVAKKVKE